MLDYRETTHGSFKAWGSGFRYDYNNEQKALNVLHQDTERLLARFNFDRFLSKSPLAYTELLNKTAQINALMVSNNQTINLSETMPLPHLSSVLSSIGGLSRHAFDLKQMHIRRFCLRFAMEFDLHSVKIKFFQPNDIENAFFIARLQTQHGNGISVRACSMTGIMAAMSDKTLRDLITMEFGHRFERSAQSLLNVSSKLSSLSWILDEEFDPSKRILASSKEKNDFINSTLKH